MMKNRPAGSSSHLPPGISSVIKKGVGSCHAMTTPDELSQLRLGWYYNWRPFQKIAPVPGVEFVPMFWSARDLTPENLAAVNDSAATHVLGFNEPDMDGQSNMTPEECLDLWPQLMALKQRLGSPGPGQWSWLEKFMPEASRRGLRVDFVCVHRYPDISDEGAVEEVEAMLQGVYDKYGLPVWLTECGVADVRAWHLPQHSKVTMATAHGFMKRLLFMLESLPFVERYAWFAERVADEYSLGTLLAMQASRLTSLGEIYRDGR